MTLHFPSHFSYISSLVIYLHGRDNHASRVRDTVAARSRHPKAGIKYKESINISPAIANPPSIIKHQKGLKSTLHLLELEYPCFSQPVNTEGRKYGPGAVNIIKGGRGVPPPLRGALSLIASVTLAGATARPPKCGANRCLCPIFVHLDHYRFYTR